MNTKGKLLTNLIPVYWKINCYIIEQVCTQNRWMGYNTKFTIRQQPPQKLYLTRPQDQETVLDFSQNLFLG